VLKAGTKAVKYREEGNKLFQVDKATEAVLFYNKSLSYCPHPAIEEYLQGLDKDQDRVKEVQFADQERIYCI
jgi:hypothetical protein